MECKRCHLLETLKTEEFGLVCTSCGTVLEESVQLTTDDGPTDNYQSSYNQQCDGLKARHTLVEGRTPRAVKAGILQVDTVANQLHITSLDIRRHAKDLIRKWMVHKDVVNRHQPFKRLLPGVAILLCLRQAGFTTTLKQVALAVGSDVAINDLCRAKNFVIKHFNVTSVAPTVEETIWQVGQELELSTECIRTALNLHRQLQLTQCPHRLAAAYLYCGHLLFNNVPYRCSVFSHFWSRSVTLCGLGRRTLEMTFTRVKNAIVEGVDRGQIRDSGGLVNLLLRRMKRKARDGAEKDDDVDEEELLAILRS